MSKKTHEKELARARAKRQAEKSAQQRQNRLYWMLAIAILAVRAIVVGLALSGDDDTPDPEVAGFSTETEDPGTGTNDEPVVVDTAAPEPAAATCPSPEGVPEITSATYDAAPEMQIDPAATYHATMVTTCGTIEIDLFAADAPLAVNNFVFLAREGFYDGVIFHRVISGFMIQGGDPTGTGTGGPGYRFEDELAASRSHGYKMGTLAMANAGPNTNGSQFFIMHQDYGLPPQYSVFGKTTEGQDVVNDIAAVSTNRQDRPDEDVVIQTVEITEA